MRTKNLLLVIAVFYSIVIWAEAPAVLTYENAPDSLKNSVFDSDGKAYFDSLFIGQGTWREYYKFYHDAYDAFSQTVAQENTAQRSIGSWVYTNLANNSTGTRQAYTGRRPNLLQQTTSSGTRHSYWDKYGHEHDYSTDKTALYFYSTQSQGLILDNYRKENAIRYYGYHTLYRRRVVTVSATMERKRTFTATSKKFLTGTYYYYNGKSDYSYADPVIQYDTTFVYTYQSTAGNVDGTSKYVSLPPNSAPAYMDPTQTVNSLISSLRNAKDSEWKCRAGCDCENYYRTSAPSTIWDENITDAVLSETKEVSSITGTKTYMSAAETVYVWGRYVTEEDNTTHLDNIEPGKQKTWNRNDTVYKGTKDPVIGGYFQPQTPTTTFQQNDDYPFMRELIADVYDTIAQVRHHYMLITPKSIEAGLYTKEDMLNYYDTTWYNLDYSSSGERYTSSMPVAQYHEWDTDYETTGCVTIFPSKTETYSNNVSVTTFAVYGKQNDGTYKLVRSIFPTTTRYGGVSNKKIYITGVCTGLYVGEEDGWMQPTDCDIYLEQSRLQCSASKASQVVTQNFDLTKEPTWEGTYSVVGSAAVFLVPSGTTRFHVKRDNYLAGYTGGKTSVNITATFDIGSLGSMTQGMSQNIYRHSAPIEIKEAQAYIEKGEKVPQEVRVVIDAEWPDGVQTNGYLDLSDCYNNVSGAHHYTAPFYTGGEHGTFIINGGRINVWPAEVYKADAVKSATKLGITVTAKAGGFSNYLLCGTSYYDLALQYSDLTFDGTLASIAQAALKNMNYHVYVYGLGQGQPKGKLIINGGTLTANTDPRSQGNVYTNNAPNVVDQPFFAPNVIINGGTIAKEIYTLTTLAKDSASWKTETKVMPKNNYSESLQRMDYVFPEANTDYTAWNIDSLNHNYECEDIVALLVNPDEENPYYYGMTSVNSDGDKKGYIYLPNTAKGEGYILARNYVVHEEDNLSQIEDGEQIANLTFYDGGEISITDDYGVYQYIRYKRKFQDNEYSAIVLPFTVDNVSVDGIDKMHSWVDERDCNGAQSDNSLAYFYLYHYDDGNGNYEAYGTGSSYQDYYHTHATGDHIDAGVPYVIKFPNAADDNYYANHYVTFKGTGVKVNGSESYKDAAVPSDYQHYVMGGNATFDRKSVVGDYYRISKSTYGNDNFQYVWSPTLEPTEAYVRANFATVSKIKQLASSPEGKDNVITDDRGIIVKSDMPDWIAYGANGEIVVETSINGNVRIVSATGALLIDTPITAGQTEYYVAPQGLYVVSMEGWQVKVCVK